MHASTTERIRRLTGWGLALIAIWAIAVELPRSLPGDSLMDFGSFVASGRAASQGLNPYGVYPLTFHVSLPGFEAWNPNLNPPISAILFQAFDWTDPAHAFRIWWGVSVLCWVFGALLLMWRYGRGIESVVVIGLWSAGLAGFWDTLVLGQIYMPLVLAGIVAWLLVERGEDVWPGLLIGFVVAMKPNFAVWPALLLLAGHSRLALVSGATVALISAMPLAVYGPEIYRQWLTLVATDAGRAAFLTNASLAGLAARVGAPNGGLVLSGAVLAGAGLWAVRCRPDRVRASEVGILAALLASPLAWIHYTLFLAPMLLRRWDQLPARFAAALLLVPVPLIIDQFGKPAWIQVSVGSIYNWALVLCFVVLATEEIRRGSLQDTAGRCDRPQPTAAV